MKISGIALIASVVTLSACGGGSNDYTPSAGMASKAIFEAACISCHAATPSGQAIALSAKTNSPEVVAAKIGSGGFTMPKFPNIQGAELKALSAWVIENSQPKQPK